MTRLLAPSAPGYPAGVDNLRLPGTPGFTPRLLGWDNPRDTHQPQETSMFEYFRIDRASFDGPVLVTGAGGCIGSWALALLIAPACRPRRST